MTIRKTIEDIDEAIETSSFEHVQRRLNGLAVELIEAVAADGIVISLCYGPCGPDRRLVWSMDMLGPGGSQHIEVPTLGQAARVAVTEARERGWIPKA